MLLYFSIFMKILESGEMHEIMRFANIANTVADFNSINAKSCTLGEHGSKFKHKQMIINLKLDCQIAE